jgi:hypothetical protein
MAGTTGLEPAASAVTGLREQILRQLKGHAGTAKRSLSRTRHRILWVENSRENCPDRYLARKALVRSAPTTGA